MDRPQGSCAIVHSDSGEGIQRLNQEAAKAMGSEEEIRAVFRRVRDEIRAKFEAYAAEIRS